MDRRSAVAFYDVERPQTGCALAGGDETTAAVVSTAGMYLNRNQRVEVEDVPGNDRAVQMAENTRLLAAFSGQTGSAHQKEWRHCCQWSRSKTGRAAGAAQPRP